MPERLETKPGWQTTEFWVALIIQLLGVLVALGIIDPEQQTAVADAVTKIGGAVMAGAASFGYSLGRGNAKRGIDPNEPT